ncbi:unnamed protein product [Camellia sinensis]
MISSEDSDIRSSIEAISKLRRSSRSNRFRSSVEDSVISSEDSNIRSSIEAISKLHRSSRSNRFRSSVEDSVISIEDSDIQTSIEAILKLHRSSRSNRFRSSIEAYRARPLHHSWLFLDQVMLFNSFTSCLSYPVYFAFEDDDINVVLADVKKNDVTGQPATATTGGMNFLSNILREEGGFHYKKAIVDSIVRDRATLYLNMLEVDGAIVETDKDVKNFLFGYLDVPLVNLEMSLKNYVQEPSEEPFDIDSVPKEVKSLPLAEKKAPGKKPTGLGAAPTAPTSTVDAYEKLLSSIPEFSSFGKLFKSSAPVELTEAETEYAVHAVQHIFDRHNLLSLFTSTLLLLLLLPQCWVRFKTLLSSQRRQEREWFAVSFKPKNFIPGLVIGFIFGLFLDLSKPIKNNNNTTPKKAANLLLGKQQRLVSTNTDEELKM